jgi:hypothetical protein
LALGRVKKKKVVLELGAEERMANCYDQGISPCFYKQPIPSAHLQMDLTSPILGMAYASEDPLGGLHGPTMPNKTDGSSSRRNLEVG